MCLYYFPPTSFNIFLMSFSATMYVPGHLFCILIWPWRYQHICLLHVHLLHIFQSYNKSSWNVKKKKKMYGLLQVHRHMLCLPDTASTHFSYQPSFYKMVHLPLAHHGSHWQKYNQQCLIILQRCQWKQRCMHRRWSQSRPLPTCFLANSPLLSCDDVTPTKVFEFNEYFNNAAVVNIFLNHILSTTAGNIK